MFRDLKNCNSRQGTLFFSWNVYKPTPRDLLVLDLYFTVIYYPTVWNPCFVIQGQFAKKAYQDWDNLVENMKI